MGKVEDDIRGKIDGLPKITEEAIQDCVQGWQNYFKKINIPEDDKQFKEYEAIVRLRLQSGIVSLAPPKFKL